MITSTIRRSKKMCLLYNFNMIKSLEKEENNASEIHRRRMGMSKKLRTKAVDHLFEAILSLENMEECYKFFEDVCTVNELLSLSQRFEVARMLRTQKTYLDIAEETGASTATISRVNRSLNYGNDGYDMVFARMGMGGEKQEQ